MLFRKGIDNLHGIGYHGASGTTQNNKEDKLVDQSFQASLSRSQGRPGWCVIFRHPVRKARNGKSGLRVRRGLGTEDETEAQALVDQMNKLLGDSTMWNPGARSRAELQYDPRIVAAFYDHLTPELRDPWEIRDEVVPLPGRDEGYARALLLGTTGAGKTTLLRQLIGTHPQTERFPSTSTAKTTTSNIEIILSSGKEYHAVVTFFTKPYVTQHVEESVTAAALAWIDTKDQKEVERKFLEHSEQRFRLSYLLGTSDIMNFASSEDDSSDDLGFDLNFFEEEAFDAGTTLSNQERSTLRDRLNAYLEEIHSLAESAYSKLADALDVSLEEADDEEKEVLQELLEDHLEDQGEFHQIVDDVLEDIQDRFHLLPKGETIAGKDGWPSHWLFSTPNRQEFVTTVNRFSSNYAPSFGRLLTPLVEGLRVSGPFAPSWYSQSDLRLVLMDGEGLGHTPDSAASVSTSITRRYKSADAILLVDNAAQPMQAAPASVLRSLVSSGYHSKLIVGFTHFDSVTGDNFLNDSMRAKHVLSSYENAVASIGKALGSRAERTLGAVKNGRMFFLSDLHKADAASNPVNARQLLKLIETIESLAEPEIPTEVVPRYDDANLILGVRSATEDFHNFWRARLNLESSMAVKAEHWTRIKALSRRLGEVGRDEYDNLRPVADLRKELGEEIYRFVENPLSWQPDHAPDDMRTQAIAQITREVDSRLHEFVSERLFISKVPEWQKAYSHRGKGSTRVRANDIRDIYDTAAPTPGKVLTPEARDFLLELRALVREAITAGGGQTIQDIAAA